MVCVLHFYCVLMTEDLVCLIGKQQLRFLIKLSLILKEKDDKLRITSINNRNCGCRRLFEAEQGDKNAKEPKSFSKKKIEKS